MKCSNCDCDIPEGYKFCPECGAPAPQNKICPSCKTEVPLKMKFCFNCGYNFENQGKTTSSGFSMGDKNVIAGDVIGNKEDISVAGNATIIKNNDQTKQLVNCHICGKNLTIVETHTCPVCGEKVCNDCFNTDSGMCKSCMNSSRQSAENEYKEALRTVLEDGIIDLQERRTLEALQVKLGISSEKAKIFEDELRYSTNEIESFTTMEKLNMDDAISAFYEEGDAQKALGLISGVYSAHMFDEKVLDVYLPILAEIDKDKALKIIDSLQADILTAYLVSIDIKITENISDAERILIHAEKLWPSNVLLMCRRCCFLYKMYEETGRELFNESFHNLVCSLPEGKTKLEETWIAKLRLFDSPGCNYKSICDSNGYYYGLLAKIGFNKKFEEITVSQDGSTGFSSISKALKSIMSGGTIHVMMGTYNESFNIDFPVNIMGEYDPASEDETRALISTEDGTVVNVNSPCTLTYLRFKNTTPSSDCNDSAKSLINILSEDCNISGCVIYNSCSNNIMISGKGKAEIQLCKIYGSLRNGIGISGSQATTIEDCEICDNELNGISIGGDNASTISNCEIMNNKLNNVFVYDSAKPSVENIDCYDAAQIGIKITDNASGSYTDCEIHGNIESNICTEKDADPVFEKCTVYESSNGCNLWINGNSKGKYTNCQFRVSHFNSVQISGTSTTVIDSCELSDIEYATISIKGDSRPNVKNNKLLGNSKSEIKVEENAKPVLENNYIKEKKPVVETVTEHVNTTPVPPAPVHNEPKHLDEAVVRSDGSGDYKTLGQALKYINNGGKIYLKSGTYREKLTIKKNVTIIGNKDKKPIIVVKNTNAFYIKQKCTIQNVIFKCDNSNLINNVEMSLVVVAAQNCNISNCEFSGGSHSNLAVLNNGGVTLSSCKSYNAQNSGVYTSGNGKCTINDCEIFNCSYGISVINTAVSVIQNSNVHNCANMGLDIEGQGNVTLKNNNISNMDYGICIFNNGYLSTEGCRFSGIGKIACQLGDGSRGKIYNSGYGKELNVNLNAFLFYGTSSFDVQNCTIAGSFFIKGNANPHIANCQIATMGISIVVDENACPSVENNGIATVGNCECIAIRNNSSGSYINNKLEGNSNNLITYAMTSKATVENNTINGKLPKVGLWDSFKEGFRKGFNSPENK